MKTMIKLLSWICLVFPLSINAQQTERTSTTAFTADVDYTCGSFLKVNFADNCQLQQGEFITRWTWYFGDGSQSNDWKPAHLYESPGMYDVKLIIHTNLGRVDSAWKNNFITVKGKVHADLGNDTAIEKGSSITLDAGNDGARYWWSTGAITQTIKVTEPGQYWVHIKKGDCESRDIINISYKQKGVFSEFEADTTYTCGSFLKVNFKETSMLEKGDFVSRWSWDFGDGTSSNDWRPAHEYQKPGLYTVKLIVQTDQGYTDTVIREKYIAIEGDVYVNLGADIAICENTSIVLDAGNPNAQVWWSTGETSQKITVTTPGEYWVHIKKGKCESRDIINVFEKPPVFPQFGFQHMGTCVPMNVQFSDSTTWCGENGILRRQWDFGDGSTSTDANPVHTFTSSDTFIVRLTVWDQNGFSITRSKRVIVAQAPGVGPLVNLGTDKTVCETEMLVLDAGYYQGASYTWSNGDFFQTTVITNTGLVWVTVQTEDGCVASDTVMVTIKPSMQAKFGYNVQTNCLPARVQFVDSTITCGVDITGWHWDFGDGTTSEQQHPSHDYLQAGEYIVQLTMFDNFGGSITRSKRVVIQPGKLTINLGKDTSICMGEMLVLNAGMQNANYNWNTGETSQEIFVMDDGAYSVTVEKNGCTGSDTINVRTIFPVTPGFEYAVTSDCLPAKVIFQDKTIANCQQVVQWRWDFGDGTTSQEQNPVHTYTTSDSFAVRLTVVTSEGITISKSKKVFVQNGAACRTNIITKAEQHKKGNNNWFNDVKVSCSPNPSHGYVYVTLSRLPEKPVKVTVIDRYGQPILVTSMTNMTTMLNLNKFAKGYYTIELSNPGGRKSIPVLIQ